MTDVLVAVMNLFIRESHYPKRWLNQTDVSLEKGCGPTLGKLRFITLAEADLQMGMRITLNSPNEELIENDKRFSKANYGSRKNYSIESAILEKRLIMDNSLNSLNHTIYNFTDLKSYYDR